MPKSIFATVRTTIYVLPETLERIRAAAGRRPLGHAVDDAFANPIVESDSWPPLSKKADYLIQTEIGRLPPRALKKPTAAAAISAMTPHPIACQCDACTLARLNSPQIRKK